MNIPLQLHTNHISEWQAGTWLHGILVTMRWCENTFQSTHLKLKTTPLSVLPENKCAQWMGFGFFFSSPLSLIMSRKVSTIDQDDFLMLGTASVSPTEHTLVSDKLTGQPLCQGTEQRCPAMDPTPFSSFQPWVQLSWSCAPPLPHCQVNNYSLCLDFPDHIQDRIHCQNIPFAPSVICPCCKQLLRVILSKHCTDHSRVREWRVTILTGSGTEL